MLAYSALNGSPGVRLLGHTPVQFRQRQFRGLGDTAIKPDGTSCDSGQVYNAFYDSCVDACPAGQSYNTEGVCTGAAAAASGGAAASSPGWASQALQALTAGFTQGALAPKPTGAKIPVAPAAPWYTTAWGIGLIAALGVGAFVLLKPAPSRTAPATVAGFFGYKTRRRSKR